MHHFHKFPVRMCEHPHLVEIVVGHGMSGLLAPCIGKRQVTGRTGCACLLLQMDQKIYVRINFCQHPPDGSALGSHACQVHHHTGRLHVRIA